MKLSRMAKSRKYNIMNTMFQNKMQGERSTWTSPNGITKRELNCILTNRQNIVTDAGVIY